MTSRTPLVAIAGQLQELPAGDGIPTSKIENFDAAAVAALGAVSYSAKNAVINGGMKVAQRADLTLGSSAPAANAGYGKVDRFQAWATGTAVSAGTATQDTASGIGRTGYASKLSGVTLTGTGIVYQRHRIEALNSVRFKNRTASLSCVVKHDVGSSINYTLTLRKANTADTFSATTTISTGSATSVATGTETTLKLEAVSMGDCSNGIEIEVKAECGAITTKNFWLTEVQLEEGSVASTFEYLSFEQELARCQRYFEKSFDYSTAPAEGSSYSNGKGIFHGFTMAGPRSCGYAIPFNIEKRIAPTIVFYKASYPGGATNGYWYYYEYGTTGGYGGAPSAYGGTKLISGYFTITAGTDGLSGQVYGHWTASAEL